MIRTLAAIPLLAGCASYQPGIVDAGQALDSATTAVGISQGLVEGNAAVAGAIASPVGAVGVIAAKQGLAQFAKSQAHEDCIQVSTLVFGGGAGAGAANIALLAGAAGGLAVAAPAAIILGTGYYLLGGADHDCKSAPDSVIAFPPLQPGPLNEA